MNKSQQVLMGAAAGAAGTTALNAVSYLDMVARARPASSTPEATVRQLSEKAHLPIPGSVDEQSNRLAGLGPLTGLTTGVAVGALLGLAVGEVKNPGLVTLAATATLAALVAGNAPMTALGVTDPRTWSLQDWISDVVPHIAYGVTTAAVLRSLVIGRAAAPGRWRARLPATRLLRIAVDLTRGHVNN